MSASQRWWLEAQGRVFGPYETDQLAGFVQQGRMATSSRMGRSAQGPFELAQDWPELAGVLHLPEPAPEPAEPAERALLVLASLRDTSIETLHAALTDFGPVVRVRGTLWACRAKLPAAALRNALSRRLGPREFLFVAETRGAQAAWFNLDGDVDRELRRLWTSPSPDWRPAMSDEPSR